jgi:hypothetical protein
MATGSADIANMQGNHATPVLIGKQMKYGENVETQEARLD